LGAQAVLTEEEVAKGVELVNARLADQIQSLETLEGASSQAGAAIIGFGTAGVGVFAGLNAELIKAAAGFVGLGNTIEDSEGRIDEILGRQLSGLDAQEAAILRQANSWRELATEKLAGFDETQLQRELDAINQTEQALLDQIDAQRELQQLQLANDILAAEAAAGIITEGQAQLAFLAEERDALLARAAALGATVEELDRIAAAYDRLEDKQATANEGVGTFASGFKKAAEQASDPEALGAEAFNRVSSLAGDFGVAIAEGGDAIEAFGKRAVAALLEVIIRQILLNALSGGFGGDTDVDSGINVEPQARGGIMEGQRAKTYAFADGGILGAQGPEPRGSLASIPKGTKFRAFAGGGVADSPTMALFAEKPGMAEAFVPLGPNRKIPVEMGEGGGGTNATINLQVQSLDPRGAADTVLSSMPQIQEALAQAISSVAR
jgi:hypothetical protein